MNEDRFKEWKAPAMFNMKGSLWETEYGWRVSHPNNLELGKYTDVGTYTYINALNGVIIEENVQIGAHCSIYSEDTERGISGKIVIKKGVKIGANTVILPKRNETHYITKHVKAGSVVY